MSGPNALHKLENNYQLTNEDRKELAEYIRELESDSSYKAFRKNVDRMERENLESQREGFRLLMDQQRQAQNLGMDWF